ncbi:hypothetical protein [Actinopolymorpha alba]|uniref:divisome protein SepX/GlpR n=1 Tax=Actinopolymorpha alba TaxID=533267 RepID=UPI00036407EC|nr:hypothetical protein [Actinopolymorpha alba]
MGTGLIYAAIVAAWAAYLVPLWLRRYDEAATARSMDRFSTAVRVLARRPHEGDDAGEQYDEDVVTATHDDGEVAGVAPRVLPRASAAVRRRRVLVVLLALATVVAMLAALELVPWWALGIPGGIVLTFLMISTSVARGERRRAVAARRARRTSGVTGTSRQAAPARSGAAESGTAGSMAPGSATGDGAGDGAGEEKIIWAVLPDRDEDQSSDRAGNEELWDPVEVPLPTYVNKAKATRTVRTVEIGEPGTWTPGHSAESEQELDPEAPRVLLDETVGTDAVASDSYDDDAAMPEQEHRRAVGD